MAHDILMPQLGQAMMRGRIVEWQAATGDHVTAGVHLLTIESDKFTYEVEAPVTGRLLQLVEAGEEADVSMVLGRIGSLIDGAIDAPILPATGQLAAAMTVASPPPALPSGPLASPKAKAMAAGRIGLDDITASRPDGLIVASDVERVLAKRAAAGPASAGSAIDRLQRSWQHAPHFVQMVDADASALVAAQNLRRAGRFPATLNDILVHAAAQTLEQFPAINARIADGRPVPNRDINISLAVATERGLRTPTISDLQGKSLAWVSERTSEAIEAAKAGRAGGGQASLTISNLGAQGIRQGTPVLNLDEAVLIFAGAIIDRPVAVNGAVVVRPQITLSIAFDHRVVDGLQAAQFTAALRDRLERFDVAPWRDQAAPAAMPERVVTLSSDRKLRCDLNAGPHRWTIDEPSSVGGDDSAADPVLHVLGALVSCLSIAFKLVAARRKVPIERIAGTVEATPETGKVRQVAVRLAVWSTAEAGAVEALLKPAKAACYVHDLLREDLDLSIALSVHSSEAAS
ncbi:2-oxo acid dehydrogenase subunit E2 [Rhizorhabdus argentea]|uniref:2-oxo acid dehydrogenase subunit E2 n=1 Tax=Rhizorhabdus argentea TaxID=1387174 RepID=UPI0030EC0E92